jgi:hypothetical protein
MLRVVSTALISRLVAILKVSHRNDFLSLETPFGSEQDKLKRQWQNQVAQRRRRVKKEKQRQEATSGGDSACTDLGGSTCDRDITETASSVTCTRKRDVRGEIWTCPVVSYGSGLREYSRHFQR